MPRLRLISLATLAGLMILACTGAASSPVLQGVGNSVDDRERPASGDTDDGSNQAPITADQQLIIYTGEIELEVAELDPAVQQAEQLIVGLGGHVASSQAANGANSRYARITYRIPAERWPDALAGLRALGTRVVTEATESQDVSAQVVDLDARLANLRVTEVALQSIMDRATTIDDVLEVQRELTKVRSDIESLTAQRDLLADRAALATLEVTFAVPVAQTSRASEGWDVGREIDNALAALVRLAQGGASLLIWLALVIVPLFAPIALIIWIIVMARRRWVANHPAGPSM